MLNLILGNLLDHLLDHFIEAYRDHTFLCDPSLVLNFWCSSLCGTHVGDASLIAHIVLTLASSLTITVFMYLSLHCRKWTRKCDTKINACTHYT